MKVAILFIAIFTISTGTLARIPRDQSELKAFQRANACPSTGQHRGACPGWQIDHITPLCAFGADKADNMQWLTVQEHKWKTRTDIRVCRSLKQ